MADDGARPVVTVLDDGGLGCVLEDFKKSVKGEGNNKKLEKKLYMLLNKCVEWTN